MSDLVEFLQARVDEQEMSAYDWHDAERCSGFDRDGGFELKWCDCGYPARVLREVAAGRAILTRYEFACRQAEVNVGSEREAWEKIAGALERDVADLAAVHQDHPDYRQEWRL